MKSVGGMPLSAKTFCIFATSVSADPGGEEAGTPAPSGTAASASPSNPADGLADLADLGSATKPSPFARPADGNNPSRSRQICDIQGMGPRRTFGHDVV